MTLVHSCLGIFAKAPVPGKVKTRLAADIGPEQAAAWYARSTQAVFHSTAPLEPVAQRVLFYDPPDGEAVFAAMPHAPRERVAQSAGDLGERMHNAFLWCCAHGGRATALIGTDAPTLPCEVITEAWAALEAVDVVVGPATDGGYYLIALAAPQPTLFRDMAWSTHTVLAATVARATACGLRVHHLREWQDVDTAADLAALGPEWAPAGQEPA